MYCPDQSNHVLRTNPMAGLLHLEIKHEKQKEKRGNEGQDVPSYSLCTAGVATFIALCRTFPKSYLLHCLGLCFITDRSWCFFFMISEKERYDHSLGEECQLIVD